MKHVYQTYMEIAGEEFPCEVIGTYYAREPEWPEAFEIDQIRVQVRQTPASSPRWVDFPTKLLTLSQLERFADEALEDMRENAK